MTLLKVKRTGPGTESPRASLDSKHMLKVGYSPGMTPGKGKS